MILLGGEGTVGWFLSLQQKAQLRAVLVCIILLYDRIRYCIGFSRFCIDRPALTSCELHKNA